MIRPSNFRFVIFFSFLIFCSPLLAQQKVDVSGYVKDKAGAPLIGASVYIQSTDFGAITNADGYYKIKSVEPGSYNLVASFIGYKAQTKYNIIIKSRGNQLYNFQLEESSETLDEITVSPDQNQVSRPIETPLSTQKLTAAEIATYPGGNNDVVKVAQTLPGVSPSVGGFRNDLIIRGGAPNESVYYLDGMEIPTINHFSTQGSAGGPVGLLNVSFIDNVTLSTSSFGAQYDNPLSGVLQFEQIDGNRRDFSGNIRVSSSETALTLNGPLLKNGEEQSKLSYILSVRRSYLSFIFGLIGLPIRPDYWDYQYKINYEINAYNTLSLLGVGSIDDFDVESDDDFSDEEQALFEQVPFIEQETNAIGLTWNRRFKNGKGFMQTTLSNNLLNNEFSRFRDNENKEGLFFKNDSKEIETKLRYAYTYFSKNWKLVGGFNLQYSYYENNTTDLNRDLQYATDIDFYKYGIFANASRSFFNKKLEFSFGFRLDDDDFIRGNTLGNTFSPRLALSYEFAPNWKINGTVGRYYKIPPYTILGYQENDMLVNRNVDYTRSDHYVLGLEYVLGPSSNITLEGFYKAYDDYPISVDDSVSLANKGAGFEVLGNEKIETSGKGRAYGLELSLQQKLQRNFYGIFSYTFFFSEFTGFDRNNFLPSTWDSRHLISFTGGYKLNKNWEISARYRFAGETPFVPTDLDSTLVTYPEIILDYSRLGEVKLDVFSQLDIRIDKKWNFNKWSLNIFIEVQNILAQNIPTPPEYILATDNNGNIIEPRELIEIEQENDSPVPALGIVIDF
ncbi:TonB-dependent receptor [Sediminitomix flava]|uniref:Outer membrane receptor for ferrienterochelin and colicin n=1 Tax=Sediminitomix flava TaxID=379075 RepID=A0A316A3N4_SEDFL|nr:TonB-dependent receptor [Sediminitomix flava]PWJ44337.1 outer membrane receptor for ferrienterochelin and colicin [Sediminitomix flava]